MAWQFLGPDTLRGGLLPHLSGTDMIQLRGVHHQTRALVDSEVSIFALRIWHHQSTALAGAEEATRLWCSAGLDVSVADFPQFRVAGVAHHAMEPHKARPLCSGQL